MYGDHVFGGGVEFFGFYVGVVDAVFFSADDTGFNLQNDFVVFAELHELDGLFHVFFEWEHGAVVHVGLEEIGSAFGAATCGFFDEGDEEGVHFFRHAVVGVEGNVDVVVLGHGVCKVCERDGADDHVVEGAGRELSCAGGDLDDAVGLCLCESFECGVDGFVAGAVDGGVCESVFLRVVDHGAVLFKVYDRHWVGLLGARRLLSKVLTDFRVNT